MTKDEALAMDLALDALDIVKIHFTQNRHVNDAITAIKQARSAPVQETKQGEIFCGVDFADGVLSVSVLRRRPDDVAELLHSEQIELQPPAAQRQWIGLSEDEIAVLMMESWGCASIAPRNAPNFARAIKNKLKEKNT